MHIVLRGLSHRCHDFIHIIGLHHDVWSSAWVAYRETGAQHSLLKTCFASANDAAFRDVFVHLDSFS